LLAQRLPPEPSFWWPWEVSCLRMSWYFLKMRILLPRYGKRIAKVACQSHWQPWQRFRSCPLLSLQRPRLPADVLQAHPSHLRAAHEPGVAVYLVRDMTISTIHRLGKESRWIIGFLNELQLTCLVLRLPRSPKGLPGSSQFLLLQLAAWPPPRQWRPQTLRRNGLVKSAPFTPHPVSARAPGASPRGREK
jgi:hypothetical protein